MKRTILRTALITFLSMILITFFTAVIIGFAAPKIMGKIYRDLGMNNASLTMYEKQYDKTGEIGDLNQVFKSAVLAGNKEKIAEYSYTLVKRRGEDLKKFCGSDKSKFMFYANSAVEYNYAVNPDRSVDVAVNCGFDRRIYDAGSPLYFAIRFAIMKADADFAESLYNEFDKYKSSFTDETTEKTLNADVLKLKEVYSKN